MNFGPKNGLPSFFLCHFLLIFPICAVASSPIQKRQFLLPSYLFKANEQPKRQTKPAEMPPSAPDADLDPISSLDVPANVFPVRKAPKEPFAMRPCYFSPIQCLLHTPEHERKFQNYPEFQQNAQNAYSRAKMEQMPASNVPNAVANNLQTNPSARVKAAVVEALLAQKQQMMEKKVKARRMLRQSEGGMAIGRMEEGEEGNAAQRRHRLFGNPWRRGL